MVAPLILPQVSHNLVKIPKTMTSNTEHFRNILLNKTYRTGSGQCSSVSIYVSDLHKSEKGAPPSPNSSVVTSSPKTNVEQKTIPQTSLRTNQNKSISETSKAITVGVKRNLCESESAEAVSTKRYCCSTRNPK